MDLRVTQRSLSATTTGNLQHNLTRLQRIQEQLSSGRKLIRPSDDPTDAVSALRLRADLRRTEQLQRNGDDAIGWLASADSALMDTVDTLGRVRELALRGANASLGPQDRIVIATEVDALRDHLLSLANTTHLGRPLFGGTTSGAAAYDPTGTYVGDGGAIERTIVPGVPVPVNVTGPEAFGPPGADLFAVLADLSVHLRTDPSRLTGDVTALDAGVARVKTALADVGARHHQVEAMVDRTEVARLNATSALADVESIDIAEASMELALQEVAYQAALAATARVLQPSLLDFLR